MLGIADNLPRRHPLPSATLLCRTLAAEVNRANRAKLDLTGAGIVAPERALPEAGRGSEAPLMEAKACREYAKEMRNRYRNATRAQRGRLLDEFTAVTTSQRTQAPYLRPHQTRNAAQASGSGADRAVGHH